MRGAAALALVVAALAWPVAGGAASGVAQAWTGEVEGTLTETGHRDNEASDPDNRVVVDDSQLYRVRFTFGFRVTRDGSIVGKGVGEYLDATWHLEGRNGDAGSFSCDPEVRVPDTFKVEVVGRAKGRTLELELRLKNVFESNDELDCGADFTAYAGETHKIVDSMDVSGARKLSVDQAQASVAPINYHEELTVGEREVERDHEWRITLKHDCRGSDYTDPSSSEYVNQYDAGDALDLPVSHGRSAPVPGAIPAAAT